MKAVLALTASVAVANAALMPRQGISDIPQCALSCALGSLGSTGCDTTNFACICKATAFIESLVPCVQGKCSASDYEKTLTAAQGLCQQAGVSLSVPAAAATSAAGSSSAAATSAAATTSAPSTEATGVTSVSSEATSAATSAVTSAAVTSAAIQSSAAPTTTGAPTKASGSNSTVSSTSPPKPSGTEPSAAHRNTIALGGLGAIIALVAAFL